MDPGDDRAARQEFSGYLLVSLIALGVDASLLLLLATYMHYLLAASIGFCAGALTAYALSVRWVFRRRRLGHRPRHELLVFALVGLAGLGINAGVIHLMVASILPLVALPVNWLPTLLQAKLAAAGTTFVFNFALRKCLLF